MAADRLDQLIGSWSVRLQKAFLTAVYRVRGQVQIGLVVEMLERGQVEEALRALRIDEIDFRDFEDAIAEAYENGGRHAADKLPPHREPSGHILAINFDGRSPRAEAELRDRLSTLVKEIVADQRSMVRAALTKGMGAGLSARTVVLDIAGRIDPQTKRREGGLIGLTSSQEAWARSFGERLAAGDEASLRTALGMSLRDRRFDRIIEKAIREGIPIPAEMRATMVRAYRNRALRFRAEGIGRTEAMTALHRAQMEAMRQAIDAGQANEELVTKIWRSAADARVRDTHRALDRSKARFNSAFASPSGARLQYPGDPAGGAAEVVNCRCWLELKVDALAATGFSDPVTGGGGERGGDGDGPPPPPFPPAQPPKPDRQQLDEAAKMYVVLHGLADGNEHLAGYDLDTGEPVDAIDSDKERFVGFTPALISLIGDANKRVVLHHNHPSSTSLSRQDLQMLARFPGLHEVFAHGHDGSEYRARARRSGDWGFYQRVEEEVFRRVRAEGLTSRLAIDDAGQVYGHIVNSVFAATGQIEYTARLAGKSLAAYNTARSFFDDLIASLAESLK